MAGEFSSVRCSIALICAAAHQGTTNKVKCGYVLVAFVAQMKRLEIGAWALTTSCLAITLTWAAPLALEDSARALVTTWSPRPPRSGILIICWEWLNRPRSYTKADRKLARHGQNCWKRRRVFGCRFADLVPRIITEAGRAICFLEEKAFLPMVPPNGRGTLQRC